MQRSEFLLLVGVAAGVLLALYADAHHTKPIILEQVPTSQEEVLSELLVGDLIEAIPLVIRQTAFQPELDPEEWYGTDRKLTDFEWDALAQLIMAEARGESFEVQYYIACTVLNRADSSLFPNTVAGVIYQTQPIQFYGAWTSERYEPTDTVWEAIQMALEENRTPSDLFYFTSEGWLSGTKPWRQVGGMWFSRQGD